MDRDAALVMANEVDPAQGSFQKSEQQFYLPAIRIEQDDLKGGQVLAIGEQEVGFLKDDHAHQAIESVVGIVVVANQLVGDGLKLGC